MPWPCLLWSLVYVHNTSVAAAGVTIIMIDRRHSGVKELKAQGGEQLHGLGNGGVKEQGRLPKGGDGGSRLQQLLQREAAEGGKGLSPEAQKCKNDEDGRRDNK